MRIETKNDCVVIALTGWGHDFSWLEPSERGSTVFLAESRDHLSEIVKKHMGQKVVLCGWSLGGIHALEFATQNQGIQGLICLGTTSRFCGNSTDLHAASSASLLAMKRGLDKNKRGLGEKFIQLVHGDEEPALLESFLSIEDDFLKQGLEALSTIDLDSSLGELNIPTMVLHGRLDSLIPFAAGEKLASLIPDSKFVEVEQGGHNFVFSRDVFLEQRISEFLDNL